MNPTAKIGDNLRFEAFYVNAGVRATGLTVTVDIYRNGTKILDDQAVTEDGDGLYSYSLDGATYNTVTGNYVGVFTTAGTVDQTDVPALWVVGPNQNALAIEFTYTVTNSVTTNPIDGATVQITTDLAGANIIWSGVTDAFGVARASGTNGLPFLNAGTYYFWTYKATFSFSNPDTEVVS